MRRVALAAAFACAGAAAVAGSGVHGGRALVTLGGRVRDARRPVAMRLGDLLLRHDGGSDNR